MSLFCCSFGFQLCLKLGPAYLSWHFWNCHLSSWCCCWSNFLGCFGDHGLLDEIGHPAWLFVYILRHRLRKVEFFFALLFFVFFYSFGSYWVRNNNNIFIFLLSCCFCLLFLKLSFFLGPMESSWNTLLFHKLIIFIFIAMISFVRSLLFSLSFFVLVLCRCFACAS